MTSDRKRQAMRMHAVHAYRCTCGRDVFGNGGKAGHRRACDGRYLTSMEAYEVWRAEWEAERGKEHKP